MVWLENWLVFRAKTAAENWQEPPAIGIEEVTFSTAHGVRIHAWYLPCPQSATALLFCHGNGGNLSSRAETLQRFRNHLRCSVLIFDYPGYGKSAGKPTEAGCYASAAAGFRWLTENMRFSADQVILYGESLGGAVAVEMASRQNHRALVLTKTFTSLPAVAQRLYRWLPVKWLMRNRFDSIAKIAKCRGPVFIASGTLDRIVPYAQGEALFKAAQEPKRFFPLIDQDHNCKLPDGYVIALRQFLDENPVT